MKIKYAIYTLLILGFGAFITYRIIENNGTSSGWTKTKLTGTGNTLILDPMTGLGTSITNGLVPPVGCFSDPERYWWRFSVNKIAGSGISFASILPVAEPY